MLPAPKPAPKPRLKKQLRENQCLKAEALKELINTFDTEWGSRLGPHESVKSFNQLNAVRMHICTIINDEILCRKEEKLMEHFKKVFDQFLTMTNYLPMLQQKLN